MATTTTESILEDWFYSAGRAGDYATMHIWDGDGDASRVFEFNFTGGYLSTSHIKSFMVHTTSRTKVDLSLNWLGPNTATLSQAVPVGWQVTIYRDTPKDKPLASYIDGAVLNALNLERNSDQAMFAVSEMVDRFDVVVSTSEEALKVAGSTIDAAREAVATANAASANADSSVAVSTDANNKATSALAAATEANSTAHGIDAKAQTALDNSKSAVSDASSAKATAEGIDSKAQSALDASKDAVGTANTAATASNSALEVAKGIDAKAQAALDSTSHLVYTSDFSGDLAWQIEQAAQKLAESGGTIRLPAGEQSLTRTVNLNVSVPIRILGEVSTLIKVTKDADAINVKCTGNGALHMEDVRFLPIFEGNSSGAACIRVKSDYASVGVSLRRVVVQGHLGGQFRYGVHLTGGVLCEISSLRVEGKAASRHTTGLYVTTTDKFAVDWNIDTLTGTNLAVGLHVVPSGSSSSTIEGIKVSNSTLIECDRGVLWASSVACPYLSIVDSHLSAYQSVIEVTNGNQVFLSNVLIYTLGSAPAITLSSCTQVHVEGVAHTRVGNYRGCTIRVVGGGYITLASLQGHSTDNSLVKLEGSLSAPITVGSGCVYGGSGVLLDRADYSGYLGYVRVSPGTAVPPGDTLLGGLAVVEGNSLRLDTPLRGVLELPSGAVITALYGASPGKTYTLKCPEGTTIKSTAVAGMSYSGDTPIVAEEYLQIVATSTDRAVLVGRSNPNRIKDTTVVSLTASVPAGKMTPVYSWPATKSRAGDLVQVNWAIGSPIGDAQVWASAYRGYVTVYAYCESAVTLGGQARLTLIGSL